MYRILKASLILWGILLVPCGHAFPQNYMNVLNLRYYIQPGITMKDTSVSMSAYEYRFEAAIPLELKNDNIVGLKPQFKSIALTGDDLSSKDLKIYSVKIPVFAFIKWGDSKWSTYIDISPKLNSDFRNISGRHFQIGAMTINYYERKKDFFWQFGIFYNQDTYGPFIMPLAGFDWKIDELNYINILLPAYAIYERRLATKLYTGFEIELSGETYRMGGSVYENSFISQLGEQKMTFLTEPRLFLDYYVAKHWVLYAKPGIRLFQKYEHYTEADERIHDSGYLEGILKNNFYIELGLAMRFRYDEADEL